MSKNKEIIYTFGFLPQCESEFNIVIKIENLLYCHGGSPERLPNAEKTYPTRRFAPVCRHISLQCRKNTELKPLSVTKTGTTLIYSQIITGIYIVLLYLSHQSDPNPKLCKFLFSFYLPSS
ncbi:hypothetical protein [Marinilabilia salmonicolor]|uniref:hypothetical protein n=1 Tax=Marinilabilia salmonicolor TaxID=989 RepID=UPI0011DFE5F1|nr:hypothetical protein [Marinilabilia salmonicolor]